MCDICKDNGFIVYNKIISGTPYKFMLHCECEKGEAYKYNTDPISKHFDLDQLTAQNIFSDDDKTEIAKLKNQLRRGY